MNPVLGTGPERVQANLTAEYGWFNDEFVDPPRDVHTYQVVGTRSIPMDEFRGRAIDFVNTTNDLNIPYGLATSNSFALSFVESLGFSRPEPVLWAPGHSFPIPTPPRSSSR